MCVNKLPALLAVLDSWRINDMYKWANLNKDGAREMKYGSTGGGEDDEHIDLNVSSGYRTNLWRRLKSSVKQKKLSKTNATSDSANTTFYMIGSATHMSPHPTLLTAPPS